MKVLVRSTSYKLRTALCSALNSSPTIYSKPWQSNPTSINCLLEAFEEHDMALFILSSIKESTDELMSTENIFVEAGMAISKYGPEGTIIITDFNTTTPSVLTQAKVFTQGDSDSIENVDNWMPGLVPQVEEAILRQQKQIVQERLEKEQYWLSLIECNPGKQLSVQYDIDKQINRKNGFGIIPVKSGIIFGEYSNFLLFKSATTNQATQFITHLRKELVETTNSIDTRLIFPGKFFMNSSLSKVNNNNPWEEDYTLNEFVLLSCKPNTVENAYEKIRELAHQPGTTNCNIICLGITFGRHDIFFIINSRSLQSLDSYYDNMMSPSFGIINYLEKNYSNLRIRNLE